MIDDRFRRRTRFEYWLERRWWDLQDLGPPVLRMAAALVWTVTFYSGCVVLGIWLATWLGII